jgi:hypothetical protein
MTEMTIREWIVEKRMKIITTTALIVACLIVVGAMGGCAKDGGSKSGAEDESPAQEKPAKAVSGSAADGADDGPPAFGQDEEKGAKLDAAADAYWDNDDLIDGDADGELATLVNRTEHTRAEESSGSYLLSGSGIVVTTSHVHGPYDEDGTLKVFVTTMDAYYTVREGSVKEVSSAIIPKAITFGETANGVYETESIEPAMDGAEFAESIRQFCKTPKGKDIPGLADKMINYYSDYGDLMELQKVKLTSYFNAIGMKGMKLYDAYSNEDPVALT